MEGQRSVPAWYSTGYEEQVKVMCIGTTDLSQDMQHSLLTSLQNSRWLIEEKEGQLIFLMSLIKYHNDPFKLLPLMLLTSLNTSMISLSKHSSSWSHDPRCLAWSMHGTLSLRALNMYCSHKQEDSRATTVITKSKGRQVK